MSCMSPYSMPFSWDHLHVMAGTAAADPVAARGAVVHLGGDSLENVTDVGQARRAAGHDVRPFRGNFSSPPPDTPVPTNRRVRVPQLLHAAAGVTEQELPPSMTMSPGSRCGGAVR